jgi:predicted AlkP superfamily pyrophosphatase or phosphodiesterase
MISIDGLVPEYYTSPAKFGLKIPNLTKARLGGAFADGIEGIYPTSTYPAHTTMVTGARPVIHGIYQNRIFDAPTAPQTKEWFWFADAIKCETLWSAARKAGLSTGNVGWPVTVKADIDYSVPEIFDPHEPTSSKRTLEYSTPGLLAKAAAGGNSDSSIDGRRTAASEYIITTYKPNLMLIHLIGLDDAQHKFGPRTPEAFAATERVDEYLGRIIEATRRAGIFNSTTFFIVSDHGFVPVTKKFEVNVVLVKEKLITLDGSGKAIDWKAAAWNNSGSCSIMLKDPNDKETAAKVIQVFTRWAGKPNSPIYRIISRADADRLGAVPPAAIMLDAASGYTFGDELTGPEIHDSPDYRGTHGHLPSRAELRSSLIVFGEQARLGSHVSIARMLDIGPTAGAVLGLPLSNAEGAAIRELLKANLPIPVIDKRKSKKAPQPPNGRE